MDSGSGVTLARRLTAEGLGSAMLLTAVVGSGIAGDRLAGGNVALALLANSTATGAALFCIIVALGPVSGGHFNPAVTVCDASRGRISWRDGGAYAAVQVLGALAGVLLTHLMFQEPLAFSRHVRQGPGQLLSEFIATFGLIAVIQVSARTRSATLVPFAVAAYVSAAYWFTASTSFANPAVTLGRCFTDTFTGIRPEDVPAFVAAQALGAVAATGWCRWLIPDRPPVAPEIATPQRVPPAAPTATVIFACVESAGRSQMAAAFFNARADPAKVRAIAAGTTPAARVHPEVVQVMREDGIDLAAAVPLLLTPTLAAGATLLVTMGCGDACPVVPGLRRDDWPLEDPKGKTLERVRTIRDDVRRRVERLVAEADWGA